MEPGGVIKYFVIIVLMTAAIVSQPAEDPIKSLPADATDRIKV